MNLSIPSGCACGREHPAFHSRVITGSGVLRQLPELVRSLGGHKVFLLADTHTDEAAGAQVCDLLTAAGMPYHRCILTADPLHPDESTVGSAVMHYTTDCDVIVSAGSGVLNDTGKILANLTGHPYVIVGTAPSMDGYASASSSMDRDGLKVSLPSKCADVILGDTDILCKAPAEMLAAGLGDMLAKYISICEWRIAHIITGEYYCEAVAEMVREALAECMAHADGLLRREPAAVEAVFRGLVIGGAAMYFAGVSRPASGVEHYFSHVWDMRGLEFGTPTDTHGIQCAVGTATAVKMYDKLSNFKPSKKDATDSVRAFSFDAWAKTLRAFLGKGAEAMIRAEEKDGKYSVEKHSSRIDRIIDGWDDILDIINTSLPTYSELLAILKSVGLPLTPEELGHDSDELALTLAATRDIRDKYVLSRLAWDIGATDYLLN
jgi:glycerol-1-phosphate dehydrogenase [NAD(P)+]